MSYGMPISDSKQGVSPKSGQTYKEVTNLVDSFLLHREKLIPETIANSLRAKAYSLDWSKIFPS
jgi:hypothetical protein